MVDEADFDSSPSLPPVEEEEDDVSVEVVVDLGRWLNLSMASALSLDRNNFVSCKPLN